MKKINEIIRNHTSYNKNENRVKSQIDFEKYENNKKTFSFKKFVPFAFVVTFLFIGVGIIIANQSSSDKIMKFTIEQRKEVSKVVYNSAIVENEEYTPFTVDFEKLKGKKSNNVFYYYTDLKVTDSFIFKVEMNCSLQPYFSEDLTGKIVDVVIANIELKTNSKKNGYLVKDQMIVITYQREVAGFTSPSQYDYHSKTDDDIYDFTGLYHFGSYVFLTTDASVKYYEEGDIIYDLYVDARDKDNIIFSSITDIADWDSTDCIDNGSVSMLEGSYAELSSEYTLSLIEQSMVKEIETSAIVLYVEDRKIYVSSDNNPTLNSVTLFPNGNIFINGEDHFNNNVTLQDGDIIRFSYYQRYQDYKPVDIYVSFIDIIR